MDSHSAAIDSTAVIARTPEAGRHVSLQHGVAAGAAVVRSQPYAAVAADSMQQVDDSVWYMSLVRASGSEYLCNDAPLCNPCFSGLLHTLSGKTRSFTLQRLHSCRLLQLCMQGRTPRCAHVRHVLYISSDVHRTHHLSHS